MRNSQYVPALFAILAILSSCALPRPAPESAVTDRELQAAELAAEAVDDYNTGRYMDSELELRQILYLFPNSDTAAYNLANTQAKLGLNAEAELTLRRLEASNPFDPRYKKALAALYYEKGDLPAAEAQYKKNIEYADVNARLLKDQAVVIKADALRSLSVISFKRGMEIQALCYSAEELMLRSNRDDAIHHVRLLLAMNRNAEAELFLNSFLAVPANQKDPYAMHLLSLVDIANGQYDQAFDHNRRADVFSNGKSDLDYEIRLVRAVLFDVSEAGKKSYEKTSEEDFETAEEERLKERSQVLTDDRLDGQSSLYWPVKFIDLVESAATAEAAKAEQE